MQNSVVGGSGNNRHCAFDFFYVRKKPNSILIKYSTRNQIERKKIIIKILRQKFWNRMIMFLNNVDLKDTMTYFEV